MVQTGQGHSGRPFQFSPRWHLKLLEPGGRFNVCEATWTMAEGCESLLCFLMHQHSPTSLDWYFQKSFDDICTPDCLSAQLSQTAPVPVFLLALQSFLHVAGAWEMFTEWLNGWTNWRDSELHLSWYLTFSLFPSLVQSPSHYLWGAGMHILFPTLFRSIFNSHSWFPGSDCHLETLLLGCILILIFIFIKHWVNDHFLWARDYT